MADVMTKVREETYRDLAGEDGRVAVSDDAHVQVIGDDGAWVTVQHWIPGWLMRDRLRRQPHQREAGL